MKDANSKRGAVNKFGTMIKTIIEYVNARHNVHHAIKDKVRDINAGSIWWIESI